jgi:hypothetical protein
MRNYSGIILAPLVIAVIFTAGCTYQTAPEASVPAPTLTTPVLTLITLPVITTPVIATPPSTVTTTPAVPTTPAVVPVTTPLPKADPTDVSEIAFSFYYDNDFSVEYPSTWTKATSMYTPYPVGPFYVYDDPRFNTPYRVITITSPDSTKKFAALTQDFEQAGTFSLKPTIEWCKEMFQRDYKDLSAANYLGNYKYFSSGNAMASTYDVTLPEGTHYYPSAYTIKTIVSLRHVYYFGFFTDTENFNKYRNLKEIMISSVKIPETEIHSVSTVSNSTTIL